MLWVNDVVFQMAVLPVDVLRLERVVEGHAEWFVSHVVPTLSLLTDGALKYSNWCTQAEQIFGANRHEALLLFQLFLSVSQGSDKPAVPAANSALSPPKDTRKLILSVDFAAFMCFLYIQRHGYNPSEHSTPAVFLKQHLSNLLHIARDAWHQTENKNNTSKNSMQSSASVESRSSQSRIPAESVLAHEVDRLGWLFSSAEGPFLTSPSALAPFWKADPSAAVPINQVVAWFVDQIDSTKTQPRTHVVTVTQGVKRISQTSLQGDNTILALKDCVDASIYVSAHVRYVHVDNCQNCTINTGVSSALLVLQNSTHCQFSSVAKKLHMYNNKHCVFNVFVPARPVYVHTPQSEGNLLSPYNTTYPSIFAHLETGHISATSGNCWSSPVVLNSHHRNDPHTTQQPASASSSNSNSLAVHSSPERKARKLNPNVSASPPFNSRRALEAPRSPKAENFTVLAPTENGLPALSLIPFQSFQPISYPFAADEEEGKTTTPQQDASLSIPFPLQSHFIAGLNLRKKQALHNRQLIDNANLTQEQQLEVKERLHAKFLEYLRKDKQAGASVEQHLQNLASYQAA